MSQFGDHDGKSKTASAVDEKHYPEINTSPDGQPADGDIAKLAHQLWTQRGCPAGSSEKDWFEAESQLRKAGNSLNALRSVRDKAGSVQP
jgi:hypothetical protein